MSPQAVRVRTSSGWQDIALQGAQGPPGPMRELAAVTYGNITAGAAPGTLFADFGTITFDGQPVTVEYVCGFLDLRTNSNATVILYDFITGTDVQVSRIGYWREGVTTDSGGQWMPIKGSFRWTPPAGNHRFRLRLQNDGGTAAVFNQLELPNYARLLSATGVGVLPGVPYITPDAFALLTPVDGMQVYLQVDATAGIVWHLRYNAGSASAYKWEYLGGSPLGAEVATDQGVTSATYTDLATVGPVVTAPLAGDYDIQIGANAYLGVGTSGTASFMSYQLGGTAANDADGMQVQPGSGLSPPGGTTFVRRKTLSGAMVITCKYRSDGSRQYNFLKRWLRVTPVRVG